MDFGHYGANLIVIEMLCISICQELLQSLDAVADDKFGRKVLLYLLHQRDPLHFHPSVVEILRQGDHNQYRWSRKIS